MLLQPLGISNRELKAAVLPPEAKQVEEILHLK